MGGIAEWRTPGWRDMAERWIFEQLDRQGLVVVGAIEQPHLYPWSTVMRVPTNEGLVYFKATMPLLAHEPRLTAALARWRPDIMPDVVAIDAERGWMLTRDAGPMLRSITRVDPPNLAPWLDILPRYAELQIDMAGRADELMALGAFDDRTATLPALYAELAADEAALMVGEPEGLTPEDAARLRALGPAFAASCAELATSGIPDTLQHDDLHDGNVFIGGGRTIFADWAECAVAFPFITLRVTLRATAHFAGLPEEAAPIRAMRDAYLEPWTTFLPRPELERVFERAQPVATLVRGLTWRRILMEMDDESRRADADVVPHNARLFLAAIDDADTEARVTRSP